MENMRRRRRRRRRAVAAAAAAEEEEEEISLGVIMTNTEIKFHMFLRLCK
jgi:hypothetical protein